MTEDDGLEALRRLYHPHAYADGLAPLSREDAQVILNKVVERAVFHDANGYVGPTIQVEIPQPPGSEFDVIYGDEIPNPEYQRHREELARRFADISRGDLNPLQQQAIRNMGNAIDKGSMGNLLFSVGETSPAFDPINSSIRFPTGDMPDRTFADTFFHETGHADTFMNGVSVSRDSDHNLVLDEIREILREPSVTTPEQAWERVDRFYGSGMEKDGQTDSVKPVSALMPESMTAAQKIAMLRELNNQFPHDETSAINQESPKLDRKSTRLNSSHAIPSRMPSSA